MIFIPPPSLSTLSLTSLGFPFEEGEERTLTAHMAHQTETWGHSVKSESEHVAAHGVKECANEGGPRSDRWRRDDARIVFQAK